MGSPGSQFTQVQPAVDAAAPGDIILIRHGNSSFYNGFIVSKGVHDHARAPRLRESGSRPTSSCAGSRPVETLVLKNLIGFYTAAIILEDNAGQVVVEKCQHGLQGGYLSIRNSANVVLNEVVGDRRADRHELRDDEPGAVGLRASHRTRC